MAITTELAAVNTMLAAIGENPVVSITASVPEVLRARSLLSQVSREVQSMNWNFNSDQEYPLEPDGSGYIYVPSTALRVDPSEPRTDLVVRQGRLYDRKTHSYEFAEAVPVDITWLFSFEDLPEQAAHYISVRAARRFQREMLGSVSLEQMSAQDEQAALVNLIDYDGAGADYNMIDNHPDNLRATLRV